MYDKESLNISLRQIQTLVKKANKSPYKAAKKRAWDSFSIYIRTRDCLRTMNSLEHGRCITCGQVYPVKGLQAGHLVPGRGNAVLFCELGVNAQCGNCNGRKHGDPLTYRRRLVDRHGENIVRALEDKKWRTRKYSAGELDLLADHYDKQTKKLRGEK